MRVPAMAGFTLIELLVVIGILGVLAGLLLPGLGRARGLGRATACLGNLRQVGVALQLYTDDNRNRLPIMRDRVPADPAATNRPPDPEPAELPSPDQVLSHHLGSLAVLRCPADREGLFASTGSSYGWNSLLNGQDALHLKVLGMPFEAHEIPVFFDKEAFHRERGARKGVNYLYADGHLRNLLVLEGSR